MTQVAARHSPAEPPNIKQVPADQAVRDGIRARARTAVEAFDPARPVTRNDLETAAQSVLHQLGLPGRYLGFAMVAVSNAFWRAAFEAVSSPRRLLFLPVCLRNRDACEGELDARGLTCVGCSDCVVHRLKTAAEDLGSRVIIAEGTPAVVSELLDCDADAILGIACLESLEKAFGRVLEIGVPYLAVPLLRDGCLDTSVEEDLVVAMLRARREDGVARPRTYAPLLREGRRIFEPDWLERLLPESPAEPAILAETDALARDWLAAGGKRFRPFVTLAAYAVARHGREVLDAGADLDGRIPLAVRRLAVAIEVLHKASLAHDDIEDGDAFRYGRETLHRALGLGPAINVGDHLIGLGYRLIADQKTDLGADCVTDVLAHLSAAHLDLCRGQGAELLAQRRDAPLSPLEVLAIYARKTAPAFETALYAGLRAAGTEVDRATLRPFANYVGEAYQIRNDLDDWQPDEHNKIAAGNDVASDRPTILRAFAVQAGLLDAVEAARDADCVGTLRHLYRTHGVFDKAERLLARLRGRAESLADNLERPELRDLFLFLTRTVLGS
jgi:geranylgeranyl pyrophosphate synthase